jgi:hypothetical protein
MTLLIILEIANWCEGEGTFQATKNEKLQSFKNDILFKVQVLPFQATHIDCWQCSHNKTNVVTIKNNSFFLKEEELIYQNENVFLFH